MENVLVIGATSGIAREICAAFARKKLALVLAARDIIELEAIASDLRIRFEVQIETLAYDASEKGSAERVFKKCTTGVCKELDGVVVCHGFLPDQERAQTNLRELRHAIDCNFTSTVSLLTLFANYFERRGIGFLAAISSVAGERGRKSNYIYGATKAALSAFMQGLRNRLYGSGVHVLTIKPGPVDTPMIKGIVNPKSLLVSTPQRVAMAVTRAIQRRKDVVYTPWYWWWITAIIRLIPESIFKRLNI